MTSEMITEISKLSSRDEIYEVYRCLKAHWQFLDTSARFTFRVGNNIKFTSSRSGIECKGVITKLNRKTAHVNVGPLPYTVPCSMLSKVEG